MKQEMVFSFYMLSVKKDSGQEYSPLKNEMKKKHVHHFDNT